MQHSENRLHLFRLGLSLKSGLCLVGSLSFGCNRRDCSPGSSASSRQPGQHRGFCHQRALNTVKSSVLSSQGTLAVTQIPPTFRHYPEIAQGLKDSLPVTALRENTTFSLYLWVQTKGITLAKEEELKYISPAENTTSRAAALIQGHTLTLRLQQKCCQGSVVNS